MKIFDFPNADYRNCVEKPWMNENALEGYLYDFPKLLELGDSYKEPENIKRQNQLERGRTDLEFDFKSPTLTHAIAELKRKTIDKRACEQLMNYLESANNKSQSLIGILVGAEIDNEAIDYIEQVKGKYLIFGIALHRFVSTDNKNIYITRQIYYPKIQARDYTKYTLIFPNNAGSMSGLGKGRLVYEGLKELLRIKNVTSFSDAQHLNIPNVWGKSRLSVINTKSNISANEENRYFKDPIVCGSDDVYICNQWGIGNVNCMIKFLENNGFQIKEEK